ncbi:MAG: ion transporter [Eubacterium sp.]|jgi:voltage-gated potassium channel|nr:ion transporter [Eubacterium sp.]
MRKKIYNVIEKSEYGNRISAAYDYFMLVVIAVSLVPLFFKQDNVGFKIIDKVTVVIFIIDYILRLVTADYKLKKGKISFIIYPFTFMAIIDLLSILPSLSIISRGFKALRVLRMIRAMRVFRIFKAMRYSKSFIIIGNVLKKSKDSLIAVCVLAFGYILISALIIYNVEPDTFETFFDALYWATVSLTTVGYGDIYPVSIMGRIITMVSSIFGIAIVALPAGIITAGYMTEIDKENDKKE